MSDQATYPYTLDIIATQKPLGYFQWAIRNRGKLVQRSDRAYAGEDEARQRGLTAIEKLRHGLDDRR